MQWGQQRKDHCSMRSTSYTATSITEVPAFMYHHDCISEQLNGRHTGDSELVALKTEDTYAWRKGLGRVLLSVTASWFLLPKAARLICDGHGLDWLWWWWSKFPLSSRRRLYMVVFQLSMRQPKKICTIFLHFYYRDSLFASPRVKCNVDLLFSQTQACKMQIVSKMETAAELR